MRIKELKDADFELVELKETPHCNLHGAMNKLTKDGIWRCMSTYVVLDFKIDKMKDNNCKAGCQEEN